MLNTFEAIYEDGRLTPLSDEFSIKKARVLVTIIEDEKGEKIGVRYRDIIKYKGVWENFPDGVKYRVPVQKEEPAAQNNTQ